MGVEGSPIPILGIAVLEACFSGVNVQAEFIVAKTLSTEAILEVEFLGASTADTKAVLYELLCLPPLSEVEVMVKVKSDTISADVCLIEAASLPNELPVIVANALVEPIKSNKEKTLSIRLINPSADSVTLHKGSIVAHVTKLDPASMVANVTSELTEFHSDVTPAVNTTE